MVLLSFSMTPMDKGESVSKYVARISKYIDGSGITYQLTPMSTILEGEWDKVMSVITECFRLLEKDCRRISINIKIDFRAGKESRMKSKIEKIEKILDKKLSQ